VTEIAHHTLSMTPSPSRRAQIVVIDDEVVLGRSIRRTLKHHDVTLLEDAESALAQLIEGALPDLVLCDLMMPGCTGMELYEALARRRPEVLSRMAFMTGGTFSLDSEDFLSQHPVTVLNKPFEEGALEGLVARALAGCVNAFGA
jgi:CheY-like chemotaxis protein